MLHNKSTKPTSGSGQGSSGRSQQSFTLLRKFLNNNDLDLIFFAYNRYLYERRPLLREEVCGIIGIWFAKEPPRLIDVKNVLDTFDDDQHPLSQKHQRSADGNLEDLQRKVNEWFNAYLERNAEANARARYLRGL